MDGNSNGSGLTSSGGSRRRPPIDKKPPVAVGGSDGFNLDGEELARLYMHAVIINMLPYIIAQSFKRVIIDELTRERLEALVVELEDFKATFKNRKVKKKVGFLTDLRAISSVFTLSYNQVGALKSLETILRATEVEEYVELSDKCYTARESMKAFSDFMKKAENVGRRNGEIKYLFGYLMKGICSDSISEGL